MTEINLFGDSMSLRIMASVWNLGDDCVISACEWPPEIEGHRVYTTLNDRAKTRLMMLDFMALPILAKTHEILQDT
jgi:hypothetical protein